MTHISRDPITLLIEKHRKSMLADFFTFLKFPSISTEAEFKEPLLACASWVMKYLKEIGFEVESWPTEGHPVIFASHLRAGPQKPTLLIYNHYDVQPVDPINEWDAPPFEPTLKGSEVYARGAQDNKGQCFYVMQAMKLLLEAHKELPINIKMCIEGEEEIGSAHLPALIKSKHKELKADYLAIVDVGIRGPQSPSVTLSTRGIITMDVELQSGKTDLHSGLHGGIAINPIHALVEILSTMRDRSGKISIPGFYDDVVEMSMEERSLFAFDFDEAEYIKSSGVHPLGGEKSFTPMERNCLRPTLEINGISGGYTGKGFKTVIPAKACAKISCRLVPNQDPQKIGELVAKYLQTQAPQGTEIRVTVHPGQGKPVRAAPTSKVVQAFKEAFEEVFQAPCDYILNGASIPIVPELTKACGGEVVLVGLGLATDQIHAPNEHFGWDRIEKGIAIMAKAIELLAQK